MKHTTQYLFGKPRSAYEPHITILAKRRVMDARFVMKELSHAKNTASPEEIPAMVERYLAVEESVKWWEAILEEE